MHDPNLIPKKHEFGILFGQKPLTKFKDYRKSIKVDLIKYDDREQMLKGTYDFAKATWSVDGRESDDATEEEMKDALAQMIGGKALGLGLETINLMFRMSGINRIDTHQIVRQRIGVTFSQMCSGDQWWSHRDALIEECIAQSPTLLKETIDSTIAAKMTYANQIDSGLVSIQAAREILPQNLDTFIFMNTNLSTLLFMHMKRIDDGSQTWSINEVAQQWADTTTAVYPELGPVFQKNKKKFTFQKDAGADRKNTYSTSLYIPEVDEYPYHDRDFLYAKTKKEMNYTNTPIEDTFYWGTMQVSESRYNNIKAKYEHNNYHGEVSHMSNEEILEMNKETNKECGYEGR